MVVMSKKKFKKLEEALLDLSITVNNQHTEIMRLKDDYRLLNEKIDNYKEEAKSSLESQNKANDKVIETLTLQLKEAVEYSKEKAKANADKTRELYKAFASQETIK